MPLLGGAAEHPPVLSIHEQVVIGTSRSENPTYSRTKEVPSTE